MDASTRPIAGHPPVLLLTLSSLLPALVAACSLASETTTPRDDSSFSLIVVDSVEQRVSGPHFSETETAVFIVAAPTAMTQSDAARIESMMVLWPDGVERPPVQGGFTPDAAGLFAHAAVPRTAPMSEGPYRLEIELEDGACREAQALYDRVPIPRVEALVVSVDDAGVALTRTAPETMHAWYVTLTSPSGKGPAATVVGGNGYASGGIMTCRVLQDMAVGVTYTLHLRLDNGSYTQVVTTTVGREGW